MNIEPRNVQMQSFSVVGREGRGPADKGRVWVPPLWQWANANFESIEAIACRQNGVIKGLWGLMSHPQRNFAPWAEEGLYLAGCETAPQAGFAQGWTRWDVPAARYIAVRLEAQNYAEVFGYMTGHYLPEHGYSLVGAVHERYPEPGNDGVMELYFTIQWL